MPNTLAHAGAQGLVSHPAVTTADLRWVYLGCVIPDLPWILLRVTHVVVPQIDPYALQSYLIIQASLLGCLLFSAAAALLAQTFWRTFAVLGTNSALHLSLDAVQTKWGVGVHFLVPFSWDSTSWGLFWPESIPTYCLTALGLLYMGWHWRPGVSEPLDLMWPSIPRLAGVLVLLGGYFFGPLFLLQEPIEANAHSLKTFSQTHERTGRPVAMDRVGYVREHGVHFLEYYGGRVRVEELGIPAPATVSVQGVFAGDNKVRVSKLHVHTRRLRDYPSYLGLALIAALWGAVFWKGYKTRE